jgi:hypothetical protein
MASDLSSAPPQKDIDNALKIFDDFIDQMGIEYFELQDLPFIDSTLFSEAQQRIELAVPFKGNDSKWRTLGGADSIVLMLAERCNSDKIATNDDGFRLIASKVKPLLIKDVY